MNINRNNYEEYFILYIDNELPVNKRKMVEEFVRVNTDLEEELLMLQQAKLIPDHSILFERKRLLLKENHDPCINLSNYQEYLLLYIDNELSIGQKIEVENFIAKHIAIQRELKILQKTSLQPEGTIVFPDKKLLYRKEKDERVFPITISIGWLRVAAAVVILAIGASTFFLINTTPEPGNEVAIGDKTIENKKVESTGDNNQIHAPTLNNRETVSVTEQKTDQAEPINKVVKKYKAGNPIANKNKIATSKKNNEEDVNDITTVNFKPISTPVNILITASAEKNDPQHIINRSAVTTEISEAYDIADGSNKKFRGFFRKATRIFERTTNIQATDEDNKLLVGAFAINLK